MALFDEKDIDFEITVENQSRHNIKFGVTLVGTDNKVKSFILQKGIRSSLKALERDGKHLHFVSQDTDEGKVLVAMSAHRSGVSYSEASVKCSRISISVDIEETDEDIEYVKRREEYEKKQRMQRMAASKKEGKPITIQVQTLDGKAIIIETFQFETIANVKVLFEDKEGTPTDQQRLVFGGKQLEDEHNLNESGIQDWSTLHVIFRLRGGGSGEEELVSDPQPVGERGVVCFGKKTHQKFGCYPKVFQPSIKYSVKGFTLELRMKSKYSLE